MRVVCILFSFLFVQGILGKAVTTSDEDDDFDFDFDEVRERRSPDFDDDDDVSDDYDNFYEPKHKSVPSSDYAVPYEFDKPSPVRFADALSTLKEAKALVEKLKKATEKGLADIAAKLKKAEDEAAKEKAAAAAKAAAKPVAKPTAKPTAKATAKPAATTAKVPEKTETYNVQVFLAKEVFDPKLQQTTSKEYQSLGKKLQDAFVAIYNTPKTKELFGFKINKFIGCGTGITTDMALKFDAAAKDPTKKLKDAVKTGKLGALVVDSTFIKIYTKNGPVCSGSCPTTTSSSCPPFSSVSPYPPAPVMYPPPVYAPATPICPASCPVQCCAPQPVCPTTCPTNCCINQGR